jgi:hypothetical protein
MRRSEAQLVQVDLVEQLPVATPLSETRSVAFRLGLRSLEEMLLKGLHLHAELMATSPHRSQWR